jgi:hypothetical protein
LRDFHRNLAIELHQLKEDDGRWLICGYPPCLGYCNTKTWPGDERQAESVYVGNVLRKYLESIGKNGKPIYALDCGAAERSEAVRLKEFWGAFRVFWSGIDVNPIEYDIYEETQICKISEMLWDEFDIILAVSTLEHCEFVKDDINKAVAKMVGALSDNGICIITVPIGREMDYGQFIQRNASSMKAILKPYSIIDERFWRWNGRNYENCSAGDTAGCLYGSTNGVRCAAAVGAWVVGK